MTPSKTLYNFTAILSLFSTENGGRKKPVYNYYKPSFSFGTKQHISGEISLLEKQELSPGDSAKAFIKLLPSRYIRKNLKHGDAFTIWEGDKVIGSGVIQKIEEERSIPIAQ
jgi:translation elongation factor EF-Tu-like GTPase